MTIVIKPGAVRAGWQHADNARAEIVSAQRRTTEAAGSDMRDLAATLKDAADDMAGVLRVVRGVIDEHDTNVEQCITDFATSDGNTAGEFHGLSR